MSRQLPKRVISGAPITVLAIWSRLMSEVVRDALDLQLELVDVGRPAQRFLVADEPLLEQAEDRLVERLHPVLRRACGDRAGNQVRLLLVDDAVADEGGADHHLDRWRAALAVGLRHQPLRDDGLAARWPTADGPASAGAAGRPR